ncbi:MAG: ImmA/IrrE family metallo-endopeptidase [Spirochaetales bacterium]|nr:ImmA/IrrE family metallo-endopeptidase [Candidatus Physcosoma equi]
MIDLKAITLSKKYASYYGRNPFDVADALDITIMVRNDFVKQKGAFKIILNRPFIFLNGKLSEQMQKIVLAHEIGHALLHREYAVKSGAIMEFELFDMKNSLEYDANVFAANLLLDDESIEDCFQAGLDVVQTAQYLGTNVNLLLLKLQLMNEKTRKYQMPDLPRRNFLGKVSDDAGTL